MDAWMTKAAAAIGAGDLSDEEIDLILELAAMAAHDSGARTNAPLLCYLVGRVQGDRSLEELAEAIRRSSS
jgi:hypothetical protein